MPFELIGLESKGREEKEENLSGVNGWGMFRRLGSAARKTFSSSKALLAAPGAPISVLRKQFSGGKKYFEKKHGGSPVRPEGVPPGGAPPAGV
jgi:hypothetical protein